MVCDVSVPARYFHREFFRQMRHFKGDAISIEFFVRNGPHRYVFRERSSSACACSGVESRVSSSTLEFRGSCCASLKSSLSNGPGCDHGGMNCANRVRSSLRKHTTKQDHRASQVLE